MSEPKRYDLVDKHYGYFLCHKIEGEWVKWEDYARLKAEVERLAMSEGYHYTAIAVSTLKEQLHQKHIDYLEARKANEAKVEMIARLKAEVERLTELNATIALRYDATKSMLDGCAKEIEEMEAEVERLTKAGDELHAFLINYIVESRISSAYLNKLDDGWHAAKEGKQS